MRKENIVTGRRLQTIHIKDSLILFEFEV